MATVELVEATAAVARGEASVEAAVRTLMGLNDTFALDGHSPPSVGGVLGCFGLFEGPKANKEAPVYGTVPQKGLKRRYLDLSQVAPGE